MKFLIKAVAILFVVCVMIFSYVMIQFNAPPKQLKLVGQLRPGMSKTEVQQILGAPQHDTESTIWTYEAHLSWSYLEISFNPTNDTYQSYYFDY